MSLLPINPKQPITAPMGDLLKKLARTHDSVSDIDVDADPLTNEKLYQSYKSSSPCIRMYTPCGVKIVFVNHTCLTDNPIALEYLDSEIALGNKYFTKGEMVTADALDPQAALVRAAIAQYEVEKAALAAAGPRDMGGTEQGGINAATTAKLDAMMTDSNSRPKGRSKR